MKNIKKGALALGAAGALFVTGLTGITSAQQDRNSNNRNSSNANTTTTTTADTGMTMSSGDTIGNMPRAEFERINAQGAQTVAAIQPTSGQLSEKDQKLMREVAMGGSMQLEVSRAALAKVTNEEARYLAQAEVDEQTALGAKLREIAAAKGVTLPAEPNPKAASLISKMEGKSGMELDTYYIKESGVKGHEKLEKTMTKVQANAEDPTLRSLAGAALPLVQTHLRVSRESLAKMSGTGNGNRSTRNSDSNGNSSSNSNTNSNKR
jgi:putative membrane protein